MGPVLQRVFAPLGRVGWRPLAVDLAFLEVPIGNLGGIRLVPGAESQAAAIGSLVLEYVRSKFRYAVLCLKASPGEPGEDAFGTLGLLKTDFLANMSVEFNGETSFEGYLARLSKKTRSEYRGYSRDFAAAGGTITIVETADEPLLRTINRLYADTLEYHKKHSNLQLPIPVTSEFFPSLLNALPGASRLFLAQLRGETIGFGLVLDSGAASYFTHAGLDYARTVPTRAYFNLYYAMLADAIRRRRRSLEMGAEAYAIKRRMGAIACPTVYHFEVTNPVLRRIATLVTRNFAAQEGAQIASASRRPAEPGRDVV
jgi:predicted N-acyltransferase